MRGEFTKLSRQVKYLVVVIDLEELDVPFCEWNRTCPLEIEFKSLNNFEFKVD